MRYNGGHKGWDAVISPEKGAEVNIVITMDVDPQYADAGHAMGITEEGYDLLCEALAELGSDIAVTKGE